MIRIHVLFLGLGGGSDPLETVAVNRINLTYILIRASTGSCGVGLRRSHLRTSSIRDPLGLVEDSGSALVKLSFIFSIPLPFIKKAFLLTL